MNRLTPQELQVQSGDTPAPQVVDVRSAEEFAAGHVPGALHIPLDELPGRLSELPHDRPVVTYCNMFHPGASRGERAAEQLSRLGFDAAVLEGGFPAWRDNAAPTEE